MTQTLWYIYIYIYTDS